MYQVILKHTRGRDYYHSYFKDASVQGTIECNILPPYHDLTMARSCYYDDGDWIFDEEMYDILFEEEQRKMNFQETYEEMQSTMEELSDAVLELATIYESVIEPLTLLAKLLRKED